MSESIKHSSSNSSEKTLFFSSLALRYKKFVKLHQEFGLLSKNSDGDRDWGNVTEHCLVEAARAEVFAGLLKISDQMKNSLIAAAILHDVGKKSEIAYLKEKGSSLETILEAQAESEKKLEEVGIGADIVYLSGATKEVFDEIDRILLTENPTEIEICYLTMHYIDDYTINTDLAQDSIGGRNDLDRRIDKNENNPNYNGINESGKEIFSGKTTYQKQRKTGYSVQEYLNHKINILNGESDASIDLPHKIDLLLQNQWSEV
jgi:hypothetical protein